MTGTFAPSTVGAGSTTSLTGTTITQPLDLTKLGAGLRSAASLAVVGTQDPLDLTGPLLGQNEVSSTVSLAVSGAGSTEGIRVINGAGNQTFWVVSDGTTTTYLTGLPNPPTNTNLVPITQLDVLLTMPDTTWTAAGGGNVAVAEQSVAPSNLLVPAPADLLSAPLRFVTTANPATATPRDWSATCWPGTVATDPLPNGALVPSPSSAFATALVPVSPAAPTCVGSAITVIAGATATVDALAQCTDATGTLVPSSVAIAGPPLHGSASVDGLTGVITYAGLDVTAVSDQFSFTIANQAGLVSAPATVTVQIVPACTPAVGSCPTGPVVPVPVPVTPTGLMTHQADWFVSLGTVALRGDFVVVSGALQPMTITDARGSGLGWSVTATVSDFVDSTSVSGTCAAPSRTCIPATNLGWIPSARVLSTSIPGSTSQVIPGPSLSDTLAPWMVPLNGANNTGNSLLCFAPAGQGGGTYRCDARLFLAIPASAGVGSYSANLTLTIA